MLGEGRELPRCSFCEKTQKQVKKLIAGPDVYICEECVDLCNEIIAEYLPGCDEAPDSSGPRAVDPPSPRDICAFLDDYVVGQSSAKRVLAVAVHNHYKRIRLAGDDSGSDDAGVELQKSNILLIGPTGCGKTLMAQTLARVLDVPFAIVDATTLTEAGYVGDDVENILLKLLQAADGDVGRAESGIVYIDEIDKIARRSESPAVTRDVSGEGVQQALLKVIEGASVSVSSPRGVAPPRGGAGRRPRDLVQIDTSGILFICGGAFTGIERIIRKRMRGSAVGFGADVRPISERSAERIIAEVTPEDMTAFGFIPEFVGRLPVVGTVRGLDRDSLVRILVEPRNALVKQYQKLFRFEDVDLRFTPEALEAVADAAIERSTGARGLRAVMEEVLLDIMYDLPGRSDVSSVLIKGDDVIRRANPALRASGRVYRFEARQRRRAG